MLDVGVIFDVRRDEPFHSVSKLWEGTIAALSERFRVRVHEVDRFAIDASTPAFAAFAEGLDALVLLSPYYELDRRAVPCPVVCFALGSLAKGGHWLWRNADSFRGSDTLLLSSTSCRALLDAVLERPALHARLVPFGVDPAVYRPRDRAALRTALGLPTDKPLLLYSGRLSPQKNGVLVLQLVRRLRQEGRDVHLVMVGARDGFTVPDLHPHPNDRAAFDAWAARLGEHVHFVPHQQDPERHAELLAAADIGINLTTALGENFGFTQVEYQLSGLAVLCSDYGGLRDTVAHGTSGFRARTHLTAAGVVLDLAEAAAYLRRLLDEPGLLAAMQAAAPEQGRRFSLASYEERLCEVVREAAGRSPSNDPLRPALDPALDGLRAMGAAAEPGIDSAHLHPRRDPTSYRHILRQVVSLVEE